MSTASNTILKSLSNEIQPGTAGWKIIADSPVKFVRSLGMRPQSAFLPEAQQAFDAVRPVARQIICVSTAEMGWFWNECKL
jgi:hypothetical protein